jgi:5-methylcytosine-specific restriction endonuclease McrA
MRAGDKDISWRTVGERDSWICHLCLKKVPQQPGKAKSPKGATVDHLIPLARGGEHVWKNVALAHRYCNVSRSTEGIAQLKLVS